MIVRFKLDACGIKLKLAEWSRMTVADREYLASAPCGNTDEETGVYRENLTALIAQRAGNTPTIMQITEHPAWSRLNAVPEIIRTKLRDKASITTEQWQRLSDLQRFALVKLSSESHESKNLPRALREFGLTSS